MDVKELLQKYTGHDNIELTSRGNTAIFSALYISRKVRLDKKTVLIPDQGGWLTYKDYPKKLGLKIVELETDFGIIDPSELKKNLDDANCLVYQNPAGYFAQQNIESIYSACKDKCLVILDVSGSIGDPELCNGKYADIIVGSFGKWKIADAGYGGFVSVKDKNVYEKAKEIFNTTDFDIDKADLVYRKLAKAPDMLKQLYKECKNIKHDLSDMDIVHPDKKGVNVVVKYATEDEKKKILAYCERHKYQWTQCPRYLRINENAISIEVKRR